MRVTNLFKSLPVFNRKNVLLLFLVILLLRHYPAQAQSKATSVLDRGTIAQNKQDDWISFPYTIQVSPYLGLTRQIPQLLNADDTKRTKQRLGIIGGSIDIGVLQIRSFIRKHFHCYPKLGLAFNYGWLENAGYLVGGLMYLEPQHDYLARWETFPRLGIGIVYANIPGTNFEEPASDEQDDTAGNPDDDFAEDFYRQGLHLDLSLALVMSIRINPHWQLSPSIGFSYLPALEEEDEAQHAPQADMDLKTVTASIALSYTPNPSLICYPSQGHNKVSRIDIGWLSAFKKFKPPPPKNQTDQQEDEEYYYVGGIYGQWSLELCNSHALLLGTEWVRDGAAEQALKRRRRVKTSPLKVSLLGGHEFRWGKLLFGQQVGIYLMNNNSQEEVSLYARLGLDYKLTDFLFMGLNMNLAIKKKQMTMETEFIDFRVGYSF